MLVKKVGDEMANFNISPEVIHAVKNEILRNDLFVKCNKGPLSSISKRTSFFKKNFPFCEPVEIFLGLDSNEKTEHILSMPQYHNDSCNYKY